VQWALENTTSSQAITLVGSSGVTVQRPGRTAPELNLTDIPVGSLISTPTNAQASLTFLSSGSRESVASIDLYGETQIEIRRAESPRFGDFSTRANTLVLVLTRGRMRVLTTSGGSRAVHIEVVSPPEVTTLIAERGVNASVVADFVSTSVTVREGQAAVQAQGQWLTLSKDQRAAVGPGDATPNGPLPVERNLIRDGDFQEELGTHWQKDIKVPAIATEPEGLVQIDTATGRRSTKFTRVGQSWGQVGLVQQLNEDVRGFSSLRLQLDVYLTYQDVGNCGAYGTECPLMVQIVYDDVNRVEHEWLQGFYYKADPPNNPLSGLTYCATCSRRFNHLQIAQNQWRTYESDDLLEAFREGSVPAAVIKRINLYASGHTFESSVAQIQLLASD
jgi:hypothetical protein